MRTDESAWTANQRVMTIWEDVRQDPVSTTDFKSCGLSVLQESPP
jgi:hypothetical protein